MLSVSTTTSASPGTYNIEIAELAKAQKLSSKGFSTHNTALQLSGEFVINGKAVSVDTNDDLMDIRDKINNLNTGTTPTEVTATILSVGSSNYRLILTSDATGKAGIDLKDASAESKNLLQGLGFTYSSSPSKTIKNVMGTDVQRSDYFTSRSSDIDILLGLTDAQSSGSITVEGDSNVSIDLDTASLDDIATTINAVAGVTASVIETTIDGQTMYYVKIEGTSTFVDNNNILETIGILKSDFETVSAEVLTADRANTESSSAIDSNTKFGDIDGASVAQDDTITISGTDHSGNTVSGTLTIDDTGDTVQELLAAIQTTYSNTVTASITSTGKILIVDDSSGTSYLSLTLTENNEGGGSLDFGVIEVAHGGSDMEMVAGGDATFTVDGLQVTSTDNTVEDVIAGVTHESIESR